MKKFKDVIKNSENQLKEIAKKINSLERGGRMVVLIQSGWHSWVFIAESKEVHKEIYDNVNIDFHMYDGGGIYLMLTESLDDAKLDQALNSLNALLARLNKRNNLIGMKEINGILMDTEVDFDNIPDVMEKLISKKSLELDY